MVRARFNHSCSHGKCHGLIDTLLTHCVMSIDHDIAAVICDSRRSCGARLVCGGSAPPRARSELTAAQTYNSRANPVAPPVRFACRSLSVAFDSVASANRVLNVRPEPSHAGRGSLRDHRRGRRRVRK